MKKFMISLICFFFLIPSVYAIPSEVYLGGWNVGISVSFDGVLVTGLYDVEGIDKTPVQVGDYIVSVNGVDITSVTSLVDTISSVTEDYATLVIRRNGRLQVVELPIVIINDTVKTGLYVKDSILGNGTLTFIDPDTNTFGVLGHPIVDSSTLKEVEISNGYLFTTKILRIDKSRDGYAGGITTQFYKDQVLGSISTNLENGVYGIYTGDITSNLIEIESLKEVHTGKAYLYTSINEEDPKYYEITIKRIDTNNQTKNFYFQVTDSTLLKKTGGIVQGMSGSPIIQDGYLIGAVTHVILDHVATGYGIGIEKMLATYE